MKCLFGLSSVSFSYGNIYDWNKNMGAHTEVNYMSWALGLDMLKCMVLKWDLTTMLTTTALRQTIRGIACMCAWVCALASVFKMFSMLVTLSFCWLPVYCNRLIFHRLHFHVHTQTNRKTARISYNICQRIYAFATNLKPYALSHRVYVDFVNNPNNRSTQAEGGWEMQATKVCSHPRSWRIYWIAEVFSWD